MNKKFLVLVALSLASSVAMAQVSPAANSGANAGATGGNLMYAPVSNDTVRYATSSAFAPPLAATEPCMGSSSLGATGMSFGVAMGSTWTDSTCELVKKANTEWNMGQHGSAIALLCTDDDMRYSISVSGGVLDRREDGAIIRRGCPMTRQEWLAAGSPLIDPDTGKVVQSGSVVTPAPVPVKVAVIESHVDQNGVRITKFPEDIEAHAAIIAANKSMHHKK
jgi:hypothetical protein